MQANINILNELKETGAVALLNATNANLYSVPEDYFQNLSGNISAWIFVSNLPASNIYEIPEGYFTHFPELIIEKINLDSKNILQGYNKVNYAVPEGYFNNLAENILQKIKKPVTVQQELEEISPFISSISKTNVYTAPENYFEKLQPASFNVIATQPKAKVISLGSRTRKWLNYAAAACIAAVLFGSGYLFFNKNKTTASGSAISYAPLAKMNVQKEISVLSDAEISDYLKDNANMAVYTDGDDDQQPNFDLQNFLENVSDQEIQNYLNQTTVGAGSGGGI